MAFYQSCGLRLHYVSRGVDPRGCRDAMVFQHGIGGDIRQPMRFLSPDRTAIAAERLSLVHADFRGHGQSELGPEECLEIGALARDLAALLDELDLERAILGGISMGAAAALRLAVDRPECCRALILCRPAWTDGPMSAPARQALGLVADLLSAQDWERSAVPALERSEILRNIEELCPDAAKSLRGQIQSVVACPQSRDHAIARLRRLPVSRGLDAHHDLAMVRCPTLILAAEGDPIHPFEYALQLARWLPAARLVAIAPKSPLDDGPHIAEVDRIVGEFLRRFLS